MPLDTSETDGLSLVGQAIVTSFERDEGAALTTFALSDLLCKVAVGAADDALQGIYASLMAAHVLAEGAGMSLDEFSGITTELARRGLLKTLPVSVMDEARDFNRTVVHIMNENMEDLLDAMPDPLNS